MTTTDSVYLRFQTKLSECVDDAVYRGVSWARHLVWTNRHRAVREPELVAGIVVKGTPLIEKGWNSILRAHGIRISAAGFFCHQRPYITLCSSGRSCELGDLLLAHFHLDRTRTFFRSALLLQAKMHAQLSKSGGDCDQLDLYTNWPPFVYGKARPDHQVPEIQVTPRARSRGAQYLVFSRLGPRPGLPPADVGMPANPVSVHGSLGAELALLPIALSGRYFGSRTEAANERASGQGNWTALVWDLIDTTATVAYASGGLGAQPREGGHILLEDAGFCYPDRKKAWDLLDQVGDGRDPAVEWDQGEEVPRGFGVIIVRTEEDR